jgi:ATP synthase protein I
MTGPRKPPEPARGGPGDGWAVMGYLLSGMIVWGGAGYLADRWLGTSFLVLIGLLLGGAGAIYLIYVRYGRP